MEGTYEYTLLLFIPATAPFDLWMPESRHGVKLHVQRVFIMDDTGQLMPSYLRFVRGVIDSSDLPLNVSREILQSSRVVDSIRSSAVKKVLRLLKDLADKEPDKYATFWKEFGDVLKEGVAEDYSNRDDIAKLLRFTTTRVGRGRAGHLARGLRRAHEGGPGEDLLPPRADAGRRQEQPAPGDLRARRASRCCCSGRPSTTGS